MRYDAVIFDLFGTLVGDITRPASQLDWMFPELPDVRADHLVLDIANREMREIELRIEFGIERELGASAVDVRSLCVETPEAVAERIRELLEHVPAEKPFIKPDYGVFELPRWTSYLKLEAMLAGRKIVRR